MSHHHHDHAHGQDHHHTPALALPVSLLCAGIGPRLAVAAGGVVLVWAVSLWALWS